MLHLARQRFASQTRQGESRSRRTLRVIPPELIESFTVACGMSCSMIAEQLRQALFSSLSHAQAVLAIWRADYKTARGPTRNLDGRHRPSSPPPSTASGSGAALCEKLRAIARRITCPAGQIQPRKRTQNWIKPGSNVTREEKPPRRRPIVALMREAGHHAIFFSGTRVIRKRPDEQRARFDPFEGVFRIGPCTRLAPAHVFFAFCA